LRTRTLLSLAGSYLAQAAAIQSQMLLRSTRSDVRRRDEHPTRILQWLDGKAVWELEKLHNGVAIVNDNVTVAGPRSKTGYDKYYKARQQQWFGKWRLRLNEVFCSEACLAGAVFCNICFGKSWFVVVPSGRS
jgi:hypothetical protein